MPEDYFGEQVASRYDATTAEMAVAPTPGGRFVIEVMVPDLRRLPPGETFRPFTVSPTRLGFDECDLAGQRLVSHHFRVEDGQLASESIPFRYVWPAELDLMARLAGMTLRDRHGDWDRRPFTSESAQHISVWEKTIHQSDRK